MEKSEEINIISAVGFDLEESFRSLMYIIKQLREEVDALQEWKKKISSN